MPGVTCNCCKAPMVMHRYDGGARDGGYFTCAACGQHVAFPAAGQMFQTILPRLYPSRMSRKQQREYVRYQADQWRFRLSAEAALGLISDAERELRLAALARNEVAVLRELDGRSFFARLLSRFRS